MQINQTVTKVISILMSDDFNENNFSLILCWDLAFVINYKQKIIVEN
jgi:hypothetical protein